VILLDTSVLIDYLKGIENPESSALDRIIDKGMPFGICAFVFQETLQGARDLAEYERLREYLGSLLFHELRNGIGSYEKAALIKVKCRKAGLVIRSTIDLLIAEIAVENGLELLHRDNDFRNIASVVGELRLFDPRDVA